MYNRCVDDAWKRKVKNKYNKTELNFKKKHHFILNLLVRIYCEKLEFSKKL